jgi:hypothetical protein
MPRFYVCVGAKDLSIQFATGTLARGFYRNVFVSAPDSRSAAERALAETLDDARATGTMPSISAANLFVEEIGPDDRWLPRLRKKSGFIFYSDDTEDDGDDWEGEDD